MSESYATMSGDDHDTFGTPATRSNYSADTKSNSESSFTCISILLLMDITDEAKSRYGVQAATNFLSMVPMAFSGHEIEAFVSVQSRVASCQ